VIPVDFKQDGSGDWDFTNGLQQTTTLVEYVQLKVTTTMQFFLGEFPLDLRKGIAFFKYEIGKRFDRRLLTTLFTRAALQTTGVAEVVAMTMDLDRTTRKLARFMRLKVESGEEIEQRDLIIGDIQ
jgi:hypothetical protein